MKRSVVCLLVVCILINSCAAPATPTRAPTPRPVETATPLPIETPKEEEQPTVSSQYYPMSVGNYWVMRHIDEDGETFESRNEIIGTEEIEGVTVFISRQTISKSQRYSECYIQYGGHYVAWWGCDYREADETLYQQTRPINGPQVEHELPFEVGQERKYSSLGEIVLYDKNETREYKIDYAVRIEAVETVDVPAGRFEECFRIRTNVISTRPDSNFTAEWEHLDWFCPYVGWVKYVREVTKTTELIEYRVQ